MFIAVEAEVTYLPTGKTWRRDEALRTDHKQGNSDKEEKEDVPESETKSEGVADFLDSQSSGSDSDDSVDDSSST